MDLEKAVAAHLQWKMQLRTQVEGAGKIDFSWLDEEDRCALTQWLKDHGARFRGHPAFERLRKVHSRFHQGVLEITRSAELGDRVAALNALEGSFSGQWLEMVLAARELVTEGPDSAMARG